MPYPLVTALALPYGIQRRIVAAISCHSEVPPRSAEDTTVMAPCAPVDARDPTRGIQPSTIMHWYAGVPPAEVVPLPRSY
jgi:hypothetical protein